VRAKPPAKKAIRTLGAVLVVLGVGVVAWTIVVWRWQDPFTALYTQWEQGRLRQQYMELVQTWKPPARHKHTSDLRAFVAREARSYRRDTHSGEAIGKIVISRLGLNMVLVDGTDESSLEKGPGRDLRSYMPGEDRLVYIAGHRTTFLAPFAHIDDIRPGDYIRLELPYGTFVYRAFRHEIVSASALRMLRSPRHELLRLQACHPRFFATHRYVVDARLVHVSVPGSGGYAESR
jgi:sortase A